MHACVCVCVYVANNCIWYLHVALRHRAISRRFNSRRGRPSSSCRSPVIVTGSRWSIVIMIVVTITIDDRKYVFFFAASSSALRNAIIIVVILLSSRIRACLCISTIFVIIKRLAVASRTISISHLRKVVSVSIVQRMGLSHAEAAAAVADVANSGACFDNVALAGRRRQFSTDLPAAHAFPCYTNSSSRTMAATAENSDRRRVPRCICLAGFFIFFFFNFVFSHYRRLAGTGK